MKNVALRSYLVNDAMSVISHVDKREPRTKKEKWLKQLLERKSKKCGAPSEAWRFLPGASPGREGDRNDLS